MKKYLKAFWSQITSRLEILIPLLAGIILAWASWLLIAFDGYGFSSRFEQFQTLLTEAMTQHRAWGNQAWELLLNFVVGEFVVAALWSVAALLFVAAAVLGLFRGIKKAPKKLSQISLKKSLRVASTISFLTSLVLTTSIFSIGFLFFDRLESAVYQADRDLKRSIREQDDAVEQLSAEALEKSTASLSAMNAWLEGLNEKTSAELECLTSPNSTTYYSSSFFYVESGFYNTCSLADFLEKRWELVEEPRLQKDMDNAQAQADESQKALDAAQTLQSQLQSRKSALNSQTRFLEKLTDSISEMFSTGLMVLFFSALALVLLSLPKASFEYLAIPVRQLTKVLKSANPNLKIQPRNKTCPNCAEKIKRQALICRHCGSQVS